MNKKIMITIGLGLSVAISSMISCNSSASNSNDSVDSVPQDSVQSVSDASAPAAIEVMSESHLETPDGNLICLKPDMSRLAMDLICGEIPSADNDSIVLAFAGSFTGTEFDKGHANVAGDHVSGGKRFSGYRCTRNTGAFTWSPESGPQFFYQDYSSKLDKAAEEGGMGFAQEMMIHNGKAVKTARPLKNENVFRALCLDKNGELALYESQNNIKFGNFINALLSQGVKEALYTDMGQGWNYCFYRLNPNDKSPKFLHNQPLSYASNFVILKIKPHSPK